MIKGKKGYIRIVEAFIAIILIASVLVFMYVNNVQKPNSEDAIHKLERAILEEISSNASLRNAVLNGDYKSSDQGAINNRTLINNTIKKYINNEFNFDFKICGINEACGIDSYVNKEVFSDEISVSSNLKEYKPKIIRLFIWEK